MEDYCCILDSIVCAQQIFVPLQNWRLSSSSLISTNSSNSVSWTPLLGCLLLVAFQHGWFNWISLCLLST